MAAKNVTYSDNIGTLQQGYRDAAAQAFIADERRTANLIAFVSLGGQITETQRRAAINDIANRLGLQ
jgi:hypothetical protein